ncbi:expressed unknown protein [Seminavis robusta]|uniref:O-fucosyltransferase family protein n=1 Tax=Seminavis robusta TaxID=568900 RepID=A0A9N8HVS4_9STRA|nr:expressed unknown protein [Seminavis robusta]|eukprot:Sro2404_g326460.1 n/a (566) ;mRNA; r:10880-12577
MTTSNGNGNGNGNTTTTKSTVPPAATGSSDIFTWQRMLALFAVFMAYLQIKRVYPTLSEISNGLYTEDSKRISNSNNHTIRIPAARDNDHSTTNHSTETRIADSKKQQDRWTIIVDDPLAGTAGDTTAKSSSTSSAATETSDTSTQVAATPVTPVPIVTTEKTEVTTIPELKTDTPSITNSASGKEDTENPNTPQPTQPIPQPIIAPMDPSVFSGYLQYMSISGWSNQVVCMQHAYSIAKATNRTLVTAPVLPHFFHNGASFKDGGQYSHTYRLDSRLLEKAYLRKLKSHDYLELETVLDLEYTFAGVPTVDFRHFTDKLYDKGQMKQWIIESEFSRYNTLFTKNRPDLEETTTLGKDNVVQVLHDWTQIAHNRSSSALWTLLDSYSIKFHSSVTENDPPFRVRFSHLIRQTAKNIHQQVWGNLPYASMHVRVGDGHFAKQIRNKWNTISDANAGFMQEWLQQQQQQPAPSKIGLFVATDMDAEQQVDFSKIIHSKMPQNLTVDIWYSNMFANYTSSLQSTLVYPGIFLDQQLAACASIGFTPSLRSTFSKLIDLVRQSPGSCDL